MCIFSECRTSANVHANNTEDKKTSIVAKDKHGVQLKGAIDCLVPPTSAR